MSRVQHAASGMYGVQSSSHGLAATGLFVWVRIFVPVINNIKTNEECKIGRTRCEQLCRPTADVTTHALEADGASTTRTTESVSSDRYLLQNLPTQACAELTHRLLPTASSLPTGKARPRAVLKTAILFMAEYGCAA
jgi:hypothetical protein